MRFDWLRIVENGSGLQVSHGFPECITTTAIAPQQVVPAS